MYYFNINMSDVVEIEKSIRSVVDGVIMEKYEILELLGDE